MKQTKKNIVNPTIPSASKASKQGRVSSKGARSSLYQRIKLSVWLPIVLILGGLFFVALQLGMHEQEVLFKSQEQGLWLPTKTFWQTLSIYPGGGLSWLGCYLTTYFYHPWTGIVLLTLAWALIMLMTCRQFRLKGWGTLLSMLPVAMLVAALTQTGYWIYYQKLPGHMWVPTLGVLISLMPLRLCAQFTGRVQLVVRIVLMLLFGWFGYIYMGAWSFLTLGLLALPLGNARTTSTTSNSSTTSNTGMDSNPDEASPSVLLLLTPVVLAGTLIALVPRIAYQQVFNQTMLSEIYVAGMPCFRYGQDDCTIYRWAYYLLAASFVPALIYTWLSPSLWQKKTSRFAAAVVLIVLLFGTGKFVASRWNHDKNFHTEIAMANAIDRNDWESALQAVSETIPDTVPPTRAMVMMKDLALFRLGRIGNEMFLYPEGSRQQNAEWTVRLTQVAGKMLYYNYGKLNFSYRWCMEDGVEFGWRVEELKYMARIAMLKGEDAVAHKYFNILKQTRNHREWAEKYEKFIGQPDKMKADAEFRPICFLKEYGDRLDGDNTLVEMYLMQTFANGHGADPVYQEMTLISALRMKDIQLFWPRLFEYANMHSKEPGFHMPRYYQEAAYLYGHLENKVDISKMPFDQSVIDSYDRFMAFNGQPNIAPLSEQEKAREFKPLFGDTFYYFYFLMRGQKTN